MNDPERLRKSLRDLHDRLSRDMKRRWHRDLPFEELLSDRWKRAADLGFGKQTSVYQLSYVYGDVRVGKDTWIGPYTLLDGSGGLTIGDHCSVSAGVHVYTHDSVKWALSGGRGAYEHASVKIGDCCYIGPHSIVGKGVSVGDHSVIGAGSFVNRDIPPYTVAVGAPCRPIGRVLVGRDGNVSLVLKRRGKPRLR